MIRIELEVTPNELNDISKILIDNRGMSITVDSTPSNIVNKVDNVIEETSNPIVPTTPTPVVPEGVETAKGVNGQQIPWDARIHGSAKKKNADGSWRLKQGIDRETLVPQVEAELVAAMSATPAPVTNTPPIPVASNTPPPPPAPESVKPTTFAELLPAVTSAKAAGTLTDEKIAEVCTTLGLSQFGLIATRPDLIPQAVELLGL